ncbi:MAG: class I SAM-dependent methyltransferase [Candidatus Acidiferrales bacterium]
MTKLYSKWARVYHDLYQSIFNYRTDFLRFKSILERYSCKNVLEVGCGSGNLAPYFFSAGYQYTGLDIARAMLAIARNKTPDARFVQGDMRGFSVREKVDAVLVAGRSFSYMTTNQDVLAALGSIHKALKPGGILIFDNFEAARIFTNFQNRIRDDIQVEGRRFIRQSDQSPDLRTGWTWKWDASYVVNQGRRKQKFHDRSVLRAFTPDEVRLFLALAGFETLRISRQGVTILTVARKFKSKR